MSTHSAAHEPTSDSTLDALAAELGAMQVIANALSDIKDSDTRRRVLSWANERFVTAAVAVVAPARPMETKTVSVDDTLEVDSLYEFFERRPQNDAALLALQAAPLDVEEPRATIEPDRRDPRGGVLGMLVRGLARGLAVLAEQWQTA